MSLKTKTDLQTLDFAFRGEPFCVVATKLSVGASVTGLDLSFQGQPLGFTPSTATGPGPGGSAQVQYIIAS